MSRRDQQVPCIQSSASNSCSSNRVGPIDHEDVGLVILDTMTVVGKNWIIRDATYNGRRVLLKQISRNGGPHMANDIDILSHNNIVKIERTITDLWGTNTGTLGTIGRVGYTMEHCPVISLYKYIGLGEVRRNQATSQCLSARSKGNIIFQLADALSYLHSSNVGVIHADFNPMSIMLRTNLDPVLGDFGSSRKVGQPVQLRAGTDPFRCKEQRDGHDYGTEADVYSLGFVIYSIIKEILPFQESMDQYDPAVVADRLHANPPERPDLDRSIFGDLVSIVESCWHDDPTQRITSEDVYQRLTELYQNGQLPMDHNFDGPSVSSSSRRVQKEK